MNGCHACKVVRDKLSPSEAFVLGIMIASAQARGRMRIEGTLCDRHGRFPHATHDTTQSSGPERGSK